MALLIPGPGASKTQIRLRILYATIFLFLALGLDIIGAVYFRNIAEFLTLRYNKDPVIEGTQITILGFLIVGLVGMSIGSVYILWLLALRKRLKTSKGE